MNQIAKFEERSDEVAQHTSADPMLSIIERVASDPNIPIERLTALMDLQERQMKKAAEQAFNRSFSSCLAKMPDIPKSGENKHMGRKYSTLDDLIRTARPILAEFGLSLNWLTSIDGNEISVTAVVRHTDGFQITSTLTGQRDNGKAMNLLQGGGSTETYLKRYSGFGILGLSSGDERDDDGRAAGKTAPTISADQFLQLRELIEAANANEAAFLQWVGSPTLEEMPASKFAGAVAQLERKKANK